VKEKRAQVFVVYLSSIVNDRTNPPNKTSRIISRRDVVANAIGQYAYKIKTDYPYEQAVERVIEALKQEGFGVLTEIDVQATLKKKLDVDFRKYVILGACNPPLAHRALTTEQDIGLLLPCNVIVYEEGGGSVVGILDPISMMSVTENPDLDPVAEEAKERLQRVAGSLRG
jgi:uncharacterized protein (DUF302 family)